MQWMLSTAVLCLLVASLLQQTAHAAAVQHRCGLRPFHLNMSLSRPPALSDPVFQDPWVQGNVAVTFDALTTKDGLGSQLQRQLGAYTVAACAGLQYKPTDGFQRFTHLNASESHHMAHRLNTLLGIPTPQQPVDSSWNVVNFGRDCSINWDHLLHETKAALEQQQPTLFNISFTYGFVLTYPAMLDCVPAFRPQAPSCGQPLLRPVRVAVHIRAGDAEGDPFRLLPHAYFFNVIRAITKVLRGIQRDYLVEVYTEASFGIRHHSNGSYHRISSTEYVHDLHQNLGRHMVLLADQDLAWTFSQMVTADIFVHSMSTLSIAAGILNVQGINIGPPKGNLAWPWLQGPHWLQPANSSGAFDDDIHQQLVAEVHTRFASPCRGRLLEGGLIGTEERGGPAGDTHTGPDVRQLEQRHSSGDNKGRPSSFRGLNRLGSNPSH